MNNNSSTSSLVFIFFFIFIFSLFHHFPCASSKQGLGWCETLFQCGNITVGFPFWGGKRLKPCGHPLLELQCNQNITSLIISNQDYHVLHINQTSYTLRLVRPDLLGPFCSAKFITTTFLSPIFELSRSYKRLTVYNSCDTRLHYLSSYTCPDKGLVSISQNPDYQYSCQNSFTVNVPTSFVPKEKNLNLTDFEVVLRKGFDLEVVIDGRDCQECVSSNGICGFHSSKQVCCNVATLSSGVQCREVYYSPTSTYERCRASFSCGDQDNLQYPFWIPGREECGNPDFKLNCSKGFPEVNIASVKFRILNMSDDDSSIIRLVRSDYISNICPLDPLNVPFNRRVLPLAPDTKLLTLYYDCPDFSSDFLYSGYIGELGCVNHEKSYYVTKNIYATTLHDRFSESLKNLKGLCKRNVSIPASGPALITLQRVPTLDNLKKAIEQGFELALDRDCLACKKVWGACGYSQISSGFVCYCQNGSQSYTCDEEILKKTHGLFTKAEIGSVVGVILLAFLVLLISFLISLLKIKIADNMRQKKLKAHIPLKHYSFAKAKKITNSFAEVVGRGGFGTVYKGTLSDGRRVAVKVLKDSKGNGEDFMNEVASMSKTSHVNIVSLLGYCFEGSRRAIIYEFVGNGSLDRFISGKISMNMDWNALYGIALGVARGLEYLHYGCKTRIVHFDIKPQNVLLDDNLCPKVADFGLAKLCEKKESILSLLDTRGTVGYIAPEMISRVYGNVSHKSDVYSYGMLVLEMIGARNKEKVDQEVGSNSSSMYFPDWVYKDLETRNYGRVIGNEISSEEEEIAKKMTLVGLWCIQSSPSDRPPMNRVVEMMEGNADALVVPPKPVLQQIPTTSLPDSSWNSEESSRNSSTSEVYLCSTFENQNQRSF